MARTTRKKRDTLTGRLRAADPFELIRWLARSQSDPRKALAELVQNSLDAGAANVQITRLRKARVSELHVVDDGEGLIPDLERTEALKYIATNIGHSRKRGLTPDQRRELMLQGKYGIGLLGFWSIGKVMEIRTYVPGEPAYVLRMFEDAPRYEIERLRGRLRLDQRRTEIVVRDLHRPAVASLTARRIVDYLGSELRGQLLAHDASVMVHDRIARGRAPKVLEVVPRRFEGERLDLPESVEIPGFSSLRAELYLLPPGHPEEGTVAISAGGTVVYEDITQFEVASFGHAPWLDARLHGLLEFSDFQVPPGTRRGVVPDQAALAFAAAVRALEPQIASYLDAADRRAAAEVEANLLKQLERAFREVPRVAPEYDFFAVREPRAAPFARDESRENGSGASDTPQAPLPGGTALGSAADEGASEPPDELPLAGPLASAVIVPAETRVERLGRRRLRLEARDENGLTIRDGIDVRWHTPSPLARLEPDSGASTSLAAGPAVGTVTVLARASQNGRSADAEATVEIVDMIGTGDAAKTGIPEPTFVEDPTGGWRSRMREGTWEVNSGHPDFRLASDSLRRKLRYLTALLAKEVVLHSFPSPQLGPALERLVEVLTITERGLDRR